MKLTKDQPATTDINVHKELLTVHINPIVDMALQRDTVAVFRQRFLGI